MGRSYQFVVNGTPQSLKRHRHRKMGNFVSTYDPSSEAKEDFLYKSIVEQKPESPIMGGLELELYFYMPRPKAHYGTGKNSEKLKSSAPKSHVSKPDIDNMIKFVGDALNGIYFKDDSQICKVKAFKMYTNFTPRTEIFLTELSDE